MLYCVYYILYKQQLGILLYCCTAGLKTKWKIYTYTITFGSYLVAIIYHCENLEKPF